MKMRTVWQHTTSGERIVVETGPNDELIGAVGPLHHSDIIPCLHDEQEQIPDAWLGGYLRAHPDQRVGDAVAHWQEQERMDRELAERMAYGSDSLTRLRAAGHVQDASKHFVPKRCPECGGLVGALYGRGPQINWIPEGVALGHRWGCSLRVERPS